LRRTPKHRLDIEETQEEEMNETAAASGAGSSIEELIDGYRARRIPRTRLLAALTTAGASAAVVATLLNAAENATPGGLSPAPAGAHRQPASAAKLDLAQAHAQHISDQVAGTAAATPSQRSAAVAKIMNDYSERAVVNDPLFGGPIVGAGAIALHKTAEMAAISDVSFNLLSQTVIGNQTLATWEMKGLHSGSYYNLPATGKEINVSGATVHTRGTDGKILTETLYYDAPQMRRQLTER
jgi:predicted ester cyclase